MNNTVQRKIWAKEETERLIQCWDKIGSITIIAALLDRSTSSVQTQASRAKLPRRGESLVRHRRKWTDDEERQLEFSLMQNTDEDGMIDIYEIAYELDRTVDAISAKLVVSEIVSEDELHKKIIIPQNMRDIMFPPEPVSQDGKLADVYKMPGEIKDNRRVSKMRRCLSCSTPFWSEGAHNRMCDKCKKDFYDTF